LVIAINGGFVKSTVDCEVAVKAPNNVSVPSPTKFWMKMPDVPVGVRVPTPSNDPVMDCASAGTARHVATIISSAYTATARKVDGLLVAGNAVRAKLLAAKEMWLCFIVPSFTK